MPIDQLMLKPEFSQVSPAFLSYIGKNWQLLAASAYHNYLKQGRGLLWIDWLNELPIKSRSQEVPVIYCDLHGAVTRSLFPDGVPEDVRRLIRQYTPETMVVIRYSDGDLIRTRTVAMLGADCPIHAYKAMKGRLSEFELNLSQEGLDG